MDQAKAAVSSFLHKDGKHQTTVHETVNPAVKHEHVTRTHHENITTAIDRDVHQDHYHTTVQPIHDREVLPEKHSHNVAGVQEREFHHGNHEQIQARLQAERAQFKDTREVGATQHTQSAGATVAGEHVHHHVHEVIQPVIEKEIIQPSTVHTIVPIHEVHHNEAKHHTSSTLPALTMEQFLKSGSTLGGRVERVDHFEGAPRNIAKTLGAGAALSQETEHGVLGHHDKRDSHHSAGTAAGAGAGALGAGVAAHKAKGHRTRAGSSSSSSSSDEEKRMRKAKTGKEPGLMDRMNPFSTKA